MKKIIFCFMIISMFLITGCSSASEFEKVDETDVVVFNDANLEAIIRGKLGIESGDILGTDMQEIYSLNLNGNNEGETVSDLTGMEYATNLESISILYNDLISLDPISYLPSLTYFNLSYSTLEEQPDLNNEMLYTLNFIQVEIDNIDFVKELTTLTNFTCSSCGISDVASLKKLSDLVSLNLYGNSIADISALGDKPSLTSLNLQGNEVVDISSLSSDTALELIVLSYNHVVDLSALMNLENLYELRIYEELDEKIASRTQINELVSKGVDVYYHE